MFHLISHVYRALLLAGAAPGVHSFSECFAACNVCRAVGKGSFHDSGYMSLNNVTQSMRIEALPLCAPTLAAYMYVYTCTCTRTMLAMYMYMFRSWHTCTCSWHTCTCTCGRKAAACWPTAALTLRIYVESVGRRGGGSGKSCACRLRPHVSCRAYQWCMRVMRAV
jgi:hypothetical protein